MSGTQKMLMWIDTGRQICSWTKDPIGQGWMTKRSYGQGYMACDQWPQPGACSSRLLSMTQLQSVDRSPRIQRTEGARRLNGGTERVLRLLAGKERGLLKAGQRKSGSSGPHRGISVSLGWLGFQWLQAWMEEARRLQARDRIICRLRVAE